MKLLLKIFLVEKLLLFGVVRVIVVLVFLWCVLMIMLLCFWVILWIFCVVLLVLVGISWFMMMFFFRLISLFFLFWIEVLVRICVVFWKDVVEMNEWVCKDVLVIFSRIGLFCVGCLLCVRVFLLVVLNFCLLICLFLSSVVLFEFRIFYFCSIWCMMILMCLLLIFIFCRW